VRARTRELQELAENLELEVQERTKDLKEKINELEKFHKLAIGRELKMIELKKRIKELESQLKNDNQKKNLKDG
jgi:C4-dicarboxylate-specific signal transduction histidine kinase